jgi:hypothetical protein
VHLPHETLWEPSDDMTTIARLSLIALSLVVAATLASGCYTVLRHPSSQTLLSDDHGSRRACADCHQDSRFYHDAFDPGYYGFGSYAVDPAWSDYYYRPWWYADYWYYPPQGYPPQGASQTAETGTSHVWGNQGRREMTMPVIGGGTATGGTGASGSSSDTPTKPAEQPAKPSDRSEDEKPAQPHRAPDRRDMTPKPPPPPPN